MERYFRTLPLICLLCSGCYFDLISDAETTNQKKTTQHITDFSYNNYNTNQINDWSIDGESSTVSQDLSLNLTKLKMKIKTQYNPVLITGNNGQWNPQTGNLSIFNSVVATSKKTGTFTTDYLTYCSSNKLFKTDKPVHLKHDNISVDGVGLLGSSEEEFLEINTDIKALITIKK